MREMAYGGKGWGGMGWGGVWGGGWVLRQWACLAVSRTFSGGADRDDDVEVVERLEEAAQHVDGPLVAHVQVVDEEQHRPLHARQRGAAHAARHAANKQRAPAAPRVRSARLSLDRHPTVRRRLRSEAPVGAEAGPVP